MLENLAARWCDIYGTNDVKSKQNGLFPPTSPLPASSFILLTDLLPPCSKQQTTIVGVLTNVLKRMRAVSKGALLMTTSINFRKKKKKKKNPGKASGGVMPQHPPITAA